MITASDILGARILIVDDQDAYVRRLQRLLSKRKVIGSRCLAMRSKSTSGNAPNRWLSRARCRSGRPSSRSRRR